MTTELVAAALGVVNSEWHKPEDAPNKRMLVWAAFRSAGGWSSAATWTDSEGFKRCVKWAYLPPHPSIGEATDDQEEENLP